jgi:hypothetical protein
MLPNRPQIGPASDEYGVFSGVRENPSEIVTHSICADHIDTHDSPRTIMNTHVKCQLKHASRAVLNSPITAIFSLRNA